MDSKTNDIFIELSKRTDEVIISFSAGKDSLVLLDLSFKYFKKVHAFFMYIVKDISFQTKIIDYAENKYNIKIKQYPHFLLSKYFRYNLYRLPNQKQFDVKLLKIGDIEEKARQDFNCKWILSGLKQADSIDRRIYLRTWRMEAINDKGFKAAPLTHWKDGDIYSYLRLNKIPVPENFGKTNFEIELVKERIIPIKEKYPNDYLKIKEVFPFIGCLDEREKHRDKQISKI